MENNSLNEQELGRRESLSKLRELGIEPYPAAEYPVNASSAAVKAGYDAEKGNFNDGRLVFIFHRTSLFMQVLSLRP